MCFHSGGTALSIDVRHIERDQLNVLRCLYQHEQGLLQVLQLFQQIIPSQQQRQDVGGDDNKQIPEPQSMKQDDVIAAVQQHIDE